MNLPNRLTLLRLLLTVPFVAALSCDWRGTKTLALGLFAIASLTDYADGAIARRYQLSTDFGKLMDPLVDKIMTVAAFVCLVQSRDLPAWAVVVIVSREFLITGLRLLAAARGQVLPAERLGKHKTAWQIATILFFLLLLSLPEWVGLQQWPLLTGALLVVGRLLAAITVALTFYSGVAYLAKNWNLVREC